MIFLMRCMLMTSALLPGQQLLGSALSTVNGDGGNLPVDEPSNLRRLGEKASTQVGVGSTSNSKRTTIL